jgi:hypothetical protein
MPATSPNPALRAHDNKLKKWGMAPDGGSSKQAQKNQLLGMHAHAA